MAKIKYDGVITAAHYKPQGQVEWVRVFLRHGPIFSDRVHLDRQTLIDEIKSGKKFKVGDRVEFEAGTFETSDQVRVLENNGKSFLVIGEQQAERDVLDGVPVI